MTDHADRVLPPLVCPACRVSLQPADGGQSCPACRSSYPVRNGVPSFVDHRGFYKGRFNSVHVDPRHHPRPLRRRLYHALAWDYYTVRRRFFLRHLTSPGTLADIGCAAGTEWMRRVGPVAGIDLSRPGLERARDLAGYELVVQAEIGHVPLPDRSFSYVVTADVYGHLDEQTKESLLDDVERLAVPGGMTLHSIETLGAVRRWARAAAPDLYEKYLVESYGHIGLEEPSQVLNRLERRGWRILEVRRSLHFSLNEFLEGFAEGFPERAWRAKVGVPLAQLFYGSVVTRFVGNQLLRGVEAIRHVGTPFDSADVIFVAAEL